MSALPKDVALVSIAEVWASREIFLSSLSPEERAIEEKMRIEKRRRDFLAGRIAAKRAIQRATGHPFSRISVLPSRAEKLAGKPEVWIGGIRAHDLEISISHSSDIAAAALAEERIGFDIESIAPRERSLEALAFDAIEIRALAGLAGRVRDAAVTRLWCKKEAIAKWLGAGLRTPFCELTTPPEAKMLEGTFAFGGTEVCWARISG